MRLYGVGTMWRRCVKRVRSARKFLFYMIVGASVFAAAPVWAQDAPTKEALTKQIQNLETALGKPKVEYDQRELAWLATTSSKVLEPTIAATNWAKNLTTVLTTRKPNVLDEDLRKSIRILAVAIARFKIAERPAPPAPKADADVDDQIVALEQVLAKLKPAEGAVSALIDSSELNKLATDIATKLLDPTFATTVWAQDLAAILVDRRPKLGDDLKAALKKLEEALPPADVKLGPFLNIVQAWFGDLHYARRAARGQLRINPETGTGPRVCDATNEIRSACQGKGACPFPGTGGTKFSALKLCGEDPAPFASNDIKGLAVEFQCLHMTRAEWNELQNIWRLVPEQVPTDRSQMVMLRQETDVMLRCAAELGPVAPGQE